MFTAMNYSNQPIGALLRGPLLKTPQGQIVLITLLCYCALAALIALDVVAPPLGKTVGSAVVTCVAWPLIVFLFFVKQGAPDFRSSFWDAVTLIAVALLPVAFVVWKNA